MGWVDRQSGLKDQARLIIVYGGRKGIWWGGLGRDGLKKERKEGRKEGGCFLGRQGGFGGFSKSSIARQSTYYTATVEFGNNALYSKGCYVSMMCPLP